MNLDWFLLTAALCFTCYWVGKLTGMRRALKIIERSEELSLSGVVREIKNGERPWVREEKR